jgi:hypothetical protein
LYIQSRYAVNSDFIYVFYRVNGGSWNNLVTSGGIAPPTSYTSLAPFWIPSGITIGDTIDIAITRYTSDANLQFGAGFTSSPTSGDWVSYCGKATPYSFIFNDTDIYINVDSVSGSDVYVNCPTTTTTSSTTTTTTEPPTTTTTTEPPTTTTTTLCEITLDLNVSDGGGGSITYRNDDTLVEYTVTAVDATGATQVPAGSYTFVSFVKNVPCPNPLVPVVTPLTFTSGCNTSVPVQLGCN